MARTPAQGERPLYWVASSREDLLTMPRPVRRAVGLALSVAQFGGRHPAVKTLKGLGPGVVEIIENHNRKTYRAVYTINFSEVVYVLHVFQKKSPSGRRMSRPDLERIRTRIKAAREHYESQHGAARKGEA